MPASANRRLRVHQPAPQQRDGEQREAGGDQDQQHGGGGAAGKVEYGEHLPIDVGGEHVGGVGRPAAGQNVDDVEDAEGVRQAHDEDDRDHRLQERQHDLQQDLRRRRAVDLRRLDRLGGQAGEAGQQHQDVEGQRHPQVGDDDRRPRQPDVGEPERPGAAEVAGERVDQPVAVDEDEAPGQRADHRGDHQRQRHDGAEDPAAPEAAVERERHRQTERRLEQEARQRQAERVDERRLKLARTADAEVVVEPAEVRRAAQGGVGAVEAQPQRPADRVEHRDAERDQRRQRKPEARGGAPCARRTTGGVRPASSARPGRAQGR